MKKNMKLKEIIFYSNIFLSLENRRGKLMEGKEVMMASGDRS